MNTYTHQKNTGIVSDFVHMCKTHPVLVGSLWFGVFTVLFGISLSLGIVPKIERDESPTVFAEMQKPLPKQEEKVTELKSALPERVIVERLGIDTVVVNPLSSDIATLDAALLQGVVRSQIDFLFLLELLHDLGAKAVVLLLDRRIRRQEAVALLHFEIQVRQRWHGFPFVVHHERKPQSQTGDIHGKRV